jgi:hypothetical protein
MSLPPLGASVETNIATTPQQSQLLLVEGC